MEQAGSANPAVRVAALEALGRIGDPKAERTLAAALGQGDEQERAAAFDACLRLAEHLLEAGDRAQALNVYGKALAGAPEGHLRVAALVGLSRAGSPDLVKVVLPYVADADPHWYQIARVDDVHSRIRRAIERAHHQMRD